MIPEFIFYLCRRGFWEDLLKSRDYVLYFDLYESTMEGCFLTEANYIEGPSLGVGLPPTSQQRERIEEFEVSSK